MKGSNFFKIAAGLLLLLNTALLIFIFMRPGPPPARGPRLHKAIAGALHFDESQRVRFKTMREAHHMQLMALNATRDSLLRAYFGTLKDTSPSASGQDSLLESIERNERERVMMTYRHFGDLKALCRKDQLAGFPGTMDMAIAILLEPSKKVGPPPKD
ncbi:MAG: hypothetical protein R2791_16425 [Saprospiraceae bacterium]